MKKYFFIGGPKEGYAEEFFRRLGKLGGPPNGWKIYPLVNEKGKALHIVAAENKGTIEEHLRHFEGIYDRGEIIEIMEKK